MRDLLVLAALLGLALFACSLLAPAPEPAMAGRAAVFPHDVHLGSEVGLSCASCHPGAENGAEAGMPGLGVCIPCHVEEGAEPEEAPALPPVLAAFAPPGTSAPAWTEVTALAIPCVFSHAVHGRAGIPCADCHGPLERSAAVDAGVRVAMDACVSCHAERAVADGGCAGCHPSVTETWKPPNHAAAWAQSHGAAARLAGPSPAESCDLCHREDGPTASCEECHLAVQPEDHTLFFKNEGHGILALMDRGRCRACHQEDVCSECHAFTQPRSHGAGFGAPADRHCLACHLNGLRSCRVCHQEGAPSHLLAPPLPPSVPEHSTATGCMVCHATVRPPRHPFTGDGNYCRRCHSGP